MAAFPLEVPVTPEIALVFLLASPSSAPEILDSLGHAPPGMVARLSHDCVYRDGIRITAGETRYEVRVGRVDAAGLGAFKTRGSAPRPPDPLAWHFVARIDAVGSKYRLGLALGAAMGALIGWPLGSVGLCALVGYGAGGVIGKRMVHEEQLYVAQPRTEARLALDPGAAEIAAAVPSMAAPGPVEAASGTTLEPTPERIRQASGRIHSGHPLRVTFTNMTLIEGHSSGADDAGLHALRPNPSSGSIPPLPDVIPWARILQVETLGGSSGVGALYGGLGLGLVGAISGAAVVAGGGIGGGVSGSGAEIAGGAALGALAAGAIGALLGAAIGAPIPRWHVVY